MIGMADVAPPLIIADRGHRLGSAQWAQAWGRRCVLLLAALVVLACSSSPQTPEGQIAALIDHAEAAAESRDLGELAKLVSDDYRDPQGNDKGAALDIARFYFLRNQRIHLLVRADDIQLIATDKAAAVVYVAMAGQPIDTPSQLTQLQGDVMRFDLALVRTDSEWRVASASYQRARLEDLL